ncbi:MAG: prenyltransferase, partial [Mycobacterium sp.]|nr:prenyltransferase [Mycobacterium sp.]
GLGIRCVDDRPWVTGAETCELVLALDAMGNRQTALHQFAAIQHLREKDGSYWTGLVFSDGKRWPVERTTWTGAAVILAADALSRTTPGSGIFRGTDLPRGLEGEYDCECAISPSDR